MPVEQTVRLPGSLPLTGAAGLPVNGLAAHQGLSLPPLSPGSVLSVIGVAERSARRVRRAAGPAPRPERGRPPRDHDLLRALGADLVVPRGGSAEETVAAYRRALPEGAEVVVDAAVPRRTGARHRPGRRPPRPPPSVRSARGPGHHLPPGAGDGPPRAPRGLTELVRPAAEGAIALRTAAVLPPEEAATAHERPAAGGVRGRWLIAF
ncbi:hypothetical protein [Streptomyces sp. NPDC007905]|uniref:hypothetical protein n=1 Tax=Streptomyces sp. NPDC007905 TaxID=3364788 RepID=UPI0036EB2FA4